MVSNLVEADVQDGDGGQLLQAAHVAELVVRDVEGVEATLEGESGEL